MTVSGSTAAVIGALLAALLSAGVIALVVGVGAWLRARAALEHDERRRALLDNAPVLPVIVHGDGRIDTPKRLGQWLGLPQPPGTLEELRQSGLGLLAEDAAALAGDVAASWRTGERFSRTVRIEGSGRTLFVGGGPAPRGVANMGTIVFWIVDASRTQAEIATLSASADRLQRAFDALSLLIEAAPLPMWHRDAGLRLTLVNRAYVEAVDAVDADDAVARGVELVEASGESSPVSAAQSARATGRIMWRDVPATIAGQRRSLRVVDVPLGDAGVAGYAIDNDELERARGDFRRFVETQRDTLDRLSAGVAQFDADRTLGFCNLPFQRMFAIRPEWVADRPEFDRVLDRMREGDRVPEARDFPSWKTEQRQLFIADGASEHSWLLPGGTHLRVLAQPLPDGGLLLIFEDRTEQVQLASARDTLLRVRSATFDNLFEAVGVFAADGKLHLWNNRFKEVWGFDEAMLAQHPRVDVLAERAASRLMVPSRASQIRDLVRVATVERRSRNGRIALKDGRNFEFAAVPLPDGNALFTMLDVTDSRRVESFLRDRAEALEAADKVKTAFVANMSYELRTPLTSIGGFAEMLAKGYAGELGAQAQTYVDAILESVARLGSLVDDVLQLTQTAANLPGIDRETVDLVQLLDGAAAAIGEAARGKQQELIIDLEPSAGRVEGDARKLRNTVDELLKNAVEYTKESGRILLHAGGNAKEAMIVVSDDGPGMDTAAQAVALDRFGRPGQTNARGAVGLGLPLARQTVEAHGGTLSLVSKPDEGTAVTIVLPR